MKRRRLRILAMALLLAALAPGLTEILGEVTALVLCMDHCENEPSATGMAHCCTSLLRGCTCSGVSPVVASDIAGLAADRDSRARPPASSTGVALDGFAGEIFRPPTASLPASLS